MLNDDKSAAAAGHPRAVDQTEVTAVARQLAGVHEFLKVYFEEGTHVLGSMIRKLRCSKYSIVL